MTEPQTLLPLTTTVIDALRKQGASEYVIAAAEGVDLIRDLTVSKQLTIAKLTAQLLASEPSTAALAIGILVQVAIRADEILAQGYQNFRAIPEDVQEKIKQVVSG